jgi:hypothetical protein
MEEQPIPRERIRWAWETAADPDHSNREEAIIILESVVGYFLGGTAMIVRQNRETPTICSMSPFSFSSSKRKNSPKGKKTLNPLLDV